MKNKSLHLFTVFFCFIGLMIFASCSLGYSSSNYWKGSEKETKWAEKKFKTQKNRQVQVVENDSSAPVDAFLKNNNEKFRIGIVISGDYWEFYDNFKGLIEGFYNINWANKVTIPSSFSHCDELISWLKTKKYSDYIEIDPEYFVNVAWGDNIDELNKKYFENKPDVDLVIAYGGKAASSFYELDNYPIPVLSDAITDCVEAGITVNVDDSGKDFFSNKIDPEIYRQQIRLFHDFVQFKKLGIIYGDNPDGILYGAVNDVEFVSKERGFEIVRNTNVKEFVDEDTPELYLAALKDLVKKVDAVYIGASTAVTEYDIIPQIVEILNEAKIPSFSLEGSVRVKDGILFSLSSSGMTRSGIWMASKASHIFAGARPRSLSQRFENTISVAINLATTKKIGFKLPLDLLVNSDDFYIESEKGYVKYNPDNIVYNNKQTLIPKKRADGQKYKIAVVQSGDYWEFTEHFKGILNGLKTNRWIKQSISFDDAKSIEDIYKILEAEDYSDYIDFPKDYFEDLNWETNSHRIDKYFTANYPDVDLIIGFGGVAGKRFSEKEKFPIPVLLEGITDPIGSGIVKSVNDSGKKYLTCRVDRTQYQRQIQLFKDFTNFQKLGLVYGDDEYGRLYGAVGDVELMSLKMGFEIISNTNVKEKVDTDTVSLYLAALKDVCSRSDAVYLGASTAITEYDIMPQVVKIIQDAGIPSFALEGDIRVKNGVLMGVSLVETEKIGIYNAEKIASIFYGDVPRLLKQEFVGVSSIALNLDMAEKIGFDLPLSTLATVDQLYGGKIR